MPTYNGTRHFFGPPKGSRIQRRTCLNCGMVEIRQEAGGERRGLTLRFERGGTVFAEGNANVTRPICDNSLKAARVAKMRAAAKKTAAKKTAAKKTAVKKTPKKRRAAR